MKKFILLAGSLLAAGIVSYAQENPRRAPGPARDSARQAPRQNPVKPYGEVITDKAVTTRGLFVVHEVEGKWYFEVPDSLLKREILAVTRYAGTPAASGYYGGEIANQQSVYFEKGPSGNLLLRLSIYVNVADSNQQLFKAVQSSNVDPIVAVFDIRAYRPDSLAAVIDVTDFFKGDNSVVSVSANEKRSRSIGSIASDRSFINAIKAYPLNIEVRSTKTFNPAGGGSPSSGRSRPVPAVSEAGVLTLQMNTSLLILPEEPMKKRYFDGRVGYFADYFNKYSDDGQRISETQYIVRWRLEPKEEDMAKFKKGILVEPKKQIVYYIDPATPKKWRKYLIAGVNDWQKAFEQAGFKNAITAKEWPEDDTTMSLEDARFSVIRYFASPTPNAYGPNVHDPRSGEILESHIGWYHNVMKLVHDWYMVQAGAIDPRARTMKFDDELMGDLIRFVSSHEVGHTLGLRHNMGASSQTPVEKLRDKTWVEANGHTVSIMDYARFNYVAQPEDRIGKAGIYPRIGAYDKWAIQWGYKPIYPEKTAEEDKKILNRWIVDSLTANPRLWFGGEGIIGEPRSQTEDLGDNAAKASTYGIMNLRRVMKGLPEWTKEEGDLYENYRTMYNAVVDQYRRYIGHVAKYLGGMYMTAKSVEQPGPLYSPVPKAMLKEAVSFFNREVFTTPEWLYDSLAESRLFVRPLDHLAGIQTETVYRLLNAATLIQVNERAALPGDPYTLTEYLDDLEKGIWQELDMETPMVATPRRSLQKIVIRSLQDILKPPPPAAGALFVIIPPSTLNSDVHSYVIAYLAHLGEKIKTALPKVKDQQTRYHLEDLDRRITRALDNKD